MSPKQQPSGQPPRGQLQQQPAAAIAQKNIQKELTVIFHFTFLALFLQSEASLGALQSALKETKKKGGNQFENSALNLRIILV